MATVPGNLNGTLAGVAATVAVGMMSNAGYLAIAASATGLPVATISILAMAVVGGIVNYGVTHFSAFKTMNNLYSALPNTYSEYPGSATMPQVVTNIETKDGGNVG